MLRRRIGRRKLNRIVRRSRRIKRINRSVRKAIRL